MADLQVTSIDGVDTVLKEATVTAFKQSLRGPLIAPGDASYEEARQVWNGNIDRRPGLIARPVGVADVIQTVTFARDHHLLVAVCGGAHNVAGTSVCTGGLVIDLSLMKAIRVDPVRRTVRAEGGVKWGEFDRETQAFGLATTGGTIADTGIAGLTLGGGLGWLGYKYGLASDNLISVDIITADGKFRVASDTGGVYVNDIGQEADEGADQIRAAYGANYHRLAELKQKYDPTNLFRHNQNIKSTVYGEPTLWEQ